jgi:hypothetical protein
MVMVNWIMAIKCSEKRKTLIDIDGTKHHVQSGCLPENE